MTPDQGTSTITQESDLRFSKEVALSVQETVIIDNVIGLKYSRRKFIEKFGNTNSQTRMLEIISPSDQLVDTIRRGKMVSLWPETVIGDFMVVRFYISGKNPILRVGSYSIASKISHSSNGHGVLLTIESPTPIASAIVSGLSTGQLIDGFAINPPQEK